jgi:hypothetical protein
VVDTGESICEENMEGENLFVYVMLAEYSLLNGGKQGRSCVQY